MRSFSRLFLGTCPVPWPTWPTVGPDSRADLSAAACSFQASQRTFAQFPQLLPSTWR